MLDDYIYNVVYLWLEFGCINAMLLVYVYMFLMLYFLNLRMHFEFLVIVLINFYVDLLTLYISKVQVARASMGM